MISIFLNRGFITQFKITPFAKKEFTIESFQAKNKFDFSYSKSKKLIPLKIKWIFKKNARDYNTGNFFI